MLLVSPIAGAVSDRFDRRSVLVVMQVALMVHGLALAALARDEGWPSSASTCGRSTSGSGSRAGADS